jgi:hypothetical protein
VSRKASTLPRIAVTRREAAEMLGVSVDRITEAKEANELHPKASKIRTDGSPSKELYSVAELQSWFDGLEDA